MTKRSLSVAFLAIIALALLLGQAQADPKRQDELNRERRSNIFDSLRDQISDETADGDERDDDDSALVNDDTFNNVFPYETSSNDNNNNNKPTMMVAAANEEKVLTNLIRPQASLSEVRKRLEEELQRAMSSKVIEVSKRDKAANGAGPGAASAIKPTIASEEVGGKPRSEPVLEANEREQIRDLEKAKSIAFNSREVRLMGPDQKEVEMKDDLPTKIVIVLDNLKSEASDLWSQVSENVDKGWTDLKKAVEKAIAPQTKSN